MRRTFSQRALCLALIAAMAANASIADAQTHAYPTMAPVARYMMDRSAEIQLARSAAPAAISRDATILVLGLHGYETAVHGTNGFVCMVGRSWLAAFDWPEFWNPRVRAADCLNPQAARSLLPLFHLRSEMAMAGRSRAQILAAVKAAYRRAKLPPLENGAMDYMMSKASYLTDQGGHNAAHVMFYTQGMTAGDWGSGAAGSPVMSVPYWFYSPQSPAPTQGLPRMLVSMVMVPDWSDGTPAAGQGK